MPHGHCCAVLSAALRWLAPCLLALCVLGLGLAPPARAEEALPGGLFLVMVEDPGCVYCRKWHEEVGPGYPKSDEGKAAPLVQLRLGAKALGAFKAVKYTPTFILVRDGREVDRIVGYAGADFFWADLGNLVEKARPARSPRQPEAPTDIKLDGPPAGLAR